mgnify:CR=1 FL=1
MVDTIRALAGRGAEINLCGMVIADKNEQGNLAGFGFSYGYQWILSPHWSIEGTLGIGYAHLHYSKYPCKECGKRLSVNNRNYLGPTRAAVSIIYLLK